MKRYILKKRMRDINLKVGEIVTTNHKGSLNVGDFWVSSEYIPTLVKNGILEEITIGINCMFCDYEEDPLKENIYDDNTVTWLEHINHHNKDNEME